MAAAPGSLPSERRTACCTGPLRWDVAERLLHARSKLRGPGGEEPQRSWGGRLLRLGTLLPRRRGKYRRGLVDGNSEDTRAISRTLRLLLWGGRRISVKEASRSHLSGCNLARGLNPKSGAVLYVWGWRQRLVSKAGPVLSVFTDNPRKIAPDKIFTKWINTEYLE